ncbi:MAG TPA: hypothetical protein VK462_04635 [Nitrososphaeraceae archaeon]|nr:hypothetical protein [Nitrososphaeraceae archaeon]
MNLLEQYRVSPENKAKEKSLLERYKEKKPNENIQNEGQGFPEEGENDLEREIERNVARGTSRILETFGGLPGDLYSFAKGLFGQDTETNLPTSEKLKKFSEEASLGYTKPRGEFEEKSDEVLQDIASFMTPGSPKYSFVRNIGIPVVANLAKEGIKYGGSEKMGDAAKIGTMITLDLLNLKGGGAKKFAGNLFNESEKLIPKGQTLKSSTLEKSILNLEKSLESGGSAPSKEKALKKISEIQSKMKNGEIEVSELVDFRKNINEIKSELGGYEVQLPKHIKKKAIANLDLVKKQVINALDEYGTKSNPEFGKLNKSANEAYAAYESSDKIANFIKKTVKNSIKNPGVKTILGLAGGGYGLATKGAVLGKTAALGALPLYAGYEGYKVLHQVMKSPTLRKFYGNILKGAASGNASQVSKNAKALDKNMKE